jgi:hypothetical protein
MLRAEGRLGTQHYSLDTACLFITISRASSGVAAKLTISCGGLRRIPSLVEQTRHKGRECVYCLAFCKTSLATASNRSYLHAQ